MNRYAICAVLSDTSVRHVRECLTPLSEYVEEWIAPRAPLAYVDHTARYPKRFLENRVPTIREELDALLPVKGVVRGAFGSWTLGWEERLLLLDFEADDLAPVRDRLGEVLTETFPHVTEDDHRFRTYISIARLRELDENERYEVDSTECNTRIVFESGEIFEDDSS